MTVLYIDYGSIAKVDVTQLRLLHSDFTVLPAQAVEVRLWGVEEHQVTGHRLLEELAVYKNQDEIMAVLLSGIGLYFAFVKNVTLLG